MERLGRWQQSSPRTVRSTRLIAATSLCGKGNKAALQGPERRQYNIDQMTKRHRKRKGKQERIGRKGTIAGGVMLEIEGKLDLGEA